MTQRISDTFKTLRQNGDKALVAYITAGDPDLNHTCDLICSLDNAGVDVLELGVPFSDPTADGPIIQRASQRSLAAGTTLDGILDCVASIRAQVTMPIVLFGYYNPIFSFGASQFARRACEAGVDGILVVDLPFEESQELRHDTDSFGIDFISLITPTTAPDRIASISGQSTGFLYYVSITGVTGTDMPELAEVRNHIAMVRDASPLPVVTGFGISTPSQAHVIASVCDGVVVGSAFVTLIEEAGTGNNVCGAVAHLAASLKEALKEKSVDF